MGAIWNPPFRGGLCRLIWSYHDSQAKDLLRLWQAILDISFDWSSLGEVGEGISTCKYFYYFAHPFARPFCWYKTAFEETLLRHEDMLECFFLTFLQVGFATLSR